MTPPIVFVINGPRLSGKDTAANAMVEMAKRPDWMIERVGPKGGDALAHFGFDRDLADVYELVKDQPLDELAGLSYRDILIQYGEAMRTLHGQDYFSKQWAQNVKLLFAMGIVSAVIMPNCRFQHELDAARAVADFALLYRVYRTPKLHNDLDAWTGDIGSWLFPLVADVAQVSLINDGHIDDIRWVAFSTAFHYFKSVRRAAAAV